MNPDIKAIFLDVGNTLRIVVEDPEFQAENRRNLMKLVEAKESEAEFYEKLEAKWKFYRSTSKQTLQEASEKELWTKWLLPDYPAEKIEPLAGKLTRLWRDCDGHRVPRPEARDVIVELDRRGYILGIIANTITETEIPDWMEEDNVTQYFKAVVLSSKVRDRKPMPEIYWEAARRINMPPENCAYVGDNPVRDVLGTRKAGFAMMILMAEPETIKKEPQNCEEKADYTITSLTQLLDIFPPRANVKA